MNKIIDLKTWPEYFKAVCDGTKKFEYRKNDRDFKVGDVLILQEFDPKTEKYTGGMIAKRVTYILESPYFGLPDGYCILSITDVNERS